MRSVVSLGLAVVLLLGLQACSFTGKGEWSDSEGNSGSLKAKFRLDFQTGKIIYKLKFDNGVKEVFKFYFKGDSANIYNAKDEVIGTVAEKESLIFEIDGKQVEIFIQEPNSEEDLSNNGSITYPDGRVLTWKDELTMDGLDGLDL